MLAYSRYSRYRTKSHDKATISHVFPRYSRYGTVFLKFKEIIKRSETTKLFISKRVQIALRAFCGQQNKVRSTTSKEVKLARSIISTLVEYNKTPSLAEVVKSIHHYMNFLVFSL